MITNLRLFSWYAIDHDRSMFQILLEHPNQILSWIQEIELEDRYSLLQLKFFKYSWLLQLFLLCQKLLISFWRIQIWSNCNRWDRPWCFASFTSKKKVNSYYSKVSHIFRLALELRAPQSFLSWQSSLTSNINSDSKYFIKICS